MNIFKFGQNFTFFRFLTYRNWKNTKIRITKQKITNKKITKIKTIQTEAVKSGHFWDSFTWDRVKRRFINLHKARPDLAESVTQDKTLWTWVLRIHVLFQLHLLSVYADYDITVFTVTLWTLNRGTLGPEVCYFQAFSRPICLYLHAVRDCLTFMTTNTLSQSWVNCDFKNKSFQV